ncbi:PAP2 superfamily protein [Motilibacter rhizosphaerae]|uniref:PAP2 superfamily protein n=1 Tax=Motilibacter rhizosphaerae TaxID=598652 RepID=A0A4Q7NWI2_9ACTN|nr:phosphatase PAP2 family protein [Motilibacter rhizosphaerae]RZS91544.1 PAP2 superfamily protein [Motilibacter rhizosphaerae]
MTYATAPSRAAAPPSGAGRPRTVGLLLLLSALALLGVLGTYRVFVRSLTGQQVERAAMGGKGLALRAGGTSVTRVLDVVSVSSVALALLAAMAVGLLRGRWRSALGAALIVAGSTLTTEALKHSLLHRPTWLDGAQNSLPSGHTTVAASVAAVAVLVSPRGLRPGVALVGGAYAMVTGAATVVAGWHRPSDVISAFGVVLAWCALTAAVVVALSPPPEGRGHPGPTHRVVALFLGSSALVTGVVGAGLIGLTARRLPHPLGEVRQVAAYAGELAAVAGAGLLTTALWLVIVPVVDAAGQAVEDVQD